MSSCTYSRKGLNNAAYQIDPAKAERFAHERYNLTGQGQCVDPNTLTFDAYHRQADPNSLTINGQGGSCSALHPLHNLQGWINRENAVDRPYIDFDMVGTYAYDTLGKGRDLQQSYNGGAENSQGGWYRVNMPRDAQCCYQPLHHQPRSDSYHGNKRMSSMQSFQYNG